MAQKASMADDTPPPVPPAAAAGISANDAAHKKQHSCHGAAVQPPPAHDGAHTGIVGAAATTHATENQAELIAAATLIAALGYKK